MKRRRSGNEKRLPSLRLAHLCEEHGKDDHKYQAAARTLHRRSVARSTAAGQSALDFSDWRRYADLCCERGHFNGRPLHGGGAGCAANPSMPGEKCAVLQRLGAGSWAQEAPASLDCFVRRVRLEQCIGELRANSAGKLRKPIHLGFHRPHSWDPRGAGLGRLVPERTRFDEDDDMLSAMARELVERNGIGESADAVWRALNTEHQKLFPTNSHSRDDAPSTEMPGMLLETQPEPGRLVEPMDAASIVIFGQRPQSMSGKRRHGRPAVQEQASLFGFS